MSTFGQCVYLAGGPPFRPPLAKGGVVESLCNAKPLRFRAVHSDSASTRRYTVASASRAAATVSSISCSVWAALRKAASNCEGGSQTPAFSMARWKRPNARCRVGGAVPIGDRVIGEEEREHRSRLVGRHRDTGFAGRLRRPG